MRVLVAVPYRVQTPAIFLERTCEHFARMSYPGKQLALVPNAFKADGRKYSPNAAARNHLLDTCLCAEHTHVLWMDVDLVDVPSDLIERLLAITETEIVAPFVFVEKRNPAQPPGLDNGGWFYDIGGFCQYGHNTSPWYPHFRGHTGGVIELDSVGCCYLAPADLYRQGVRYRPNGDDVEHVSMMREARALGMKVLATDEVRVQHAYLPWYGEAWHG